MGLLASLTSSWMSNLLSGDARYSRLLRIVGTTEAVAVLLNFFRLHFSPNIILLVVWGIVVSIAAYLAAWHFRSPEYNRRRDIILSLVLLAIAPVVIIVTIFIASFFGLTGA